MTLAAPRYFGGKSPRMEIGQWIASNLPQARTGHYVEPFCGMAGIMLQRRPSRWETLNDANRYIVNWWRCIRDAPDEFARLTDCTPYSRAEFNDARDLLDEIQDDFRMPDLRVGLAAHLMLTQGFQCSMIRNRNSFRMSRNSRSPRSRWLEGGGGEMIRRLADRIAGVQLECGDAVSLLDKFRGERDSLIYCDPPYPTAYVGHYQQTPDYARLRESLLAQAGQVAISGVGAEWDDLGWRRIEMSARTPFATFAPGTAPESATRTECLWVNWNDDPAAVGRLL